MSIPQSYAAFEDDFKKWLGRAAYNDYVMAPRAGNPADTQSELEITGLAAFAAIIRNAVIKALEKQNIGKGQGYQQFPGSLADGASINIANEIINAIENDNTQNPEMRNRLKAGLTMGFNRYKEQMKNQPTIGAPQPQPTFRPKPNWA